MATEKLYSFRNLPIGWHYGSGGPPSESTLTAAATQLRNLASLGFTEFDVFPGPDYELMVSGYSGESSADITLLPNGLVDLAFQADGGEEGYKERIDPAWANIILAEVAQKCITSDSYIQDISTTEKVNLRISPSKTLPTAAVSRSYRSNVSRTQQFVYAITSANIIPMSGASLPYFGSSMNQLYSPTGQ